MIKTSTAFREAIIGSPRKVELFAVVDISDPDKTMLPVTSSPEASWSRKEQLYNYDLDPPPRYATGERGCWLGDGSFDLFPDNYRIQNEVGFAGKNLSGSSGAFSTPQWVQMNFSGVRILQAFSLYFSTDPVDGVPTDFTVEVWAGNQLYYTQEVEGNTETEVQFRGFTVYDPTAVRLTVKKWTLPFRRVRMVEFVTGLFERWTGSDLASFSATLQGQFSCLSLPYGSVSLSMDNADRRFEPRKKDSIFQSIEERQSIDLYIGCQTSEGMERVKIGVFYQAGDGWKTSSNELTMSWYLVDIIGLVANRTFLVPATLPTTLSGWMRAIVSQLGENFQNRFHVDPAYANKTVTANTREDVTGKKCGDIIRWVCQASGTWPRADQTTGRLTAEPLWNEGNKYDLDNLNTYPTMKANESLAALIFQLNTGREETQEYVVSGNSTTSEKTVTIINPFLHTSDQALAAARLILAQYGGNLLELTGRGDPSSEIGDVDTVWLDESSAATARRMSQTFQFQNGVMQQCRSSLLQADGSYLWTEFDIIRESGVYVTKPGVRQIRIVKVDGGQGSSRGQDGFVGMSGNIPGGGVTSGQGDRGLNGQGGAVWYGVIDCNEQQEFVVQIGQGGAPSDVYGQPGKMGGRTIFGSHDEEGRVYENGYTDIANGQSFARTGVAVPLPGTGDGAEGGEGGEPGSGYWEQLFWTSGDVSAGRHPGTALDGSSIVGKPRGWTFVVTKPPGKGKPGRAGATGLVMVTWEKPNTKI